MQTKQTTDSSSQAGTLFSDPQRYLDLDAWHRAAAELRRASPVYLADVPGFEPFYAILRHSDIIEIERQSQKFLNTMQPVLMSKRDQEQIRQGGGTLKTLVHMDGNEHHSYRSVTNDWFKPNAVRRQMEGRVAELARKYVDRMMELGGECDFATDIARFYPLQVIMSILGVPEQDEPLMLRLTQNLLSSDDPDFREGGGRAESINAAVGKFAEYFAKVTAARRAHPERDLASTIANGRIDGHPLDEFQTFSYYVIVATAGHDTTSSSLAGGIRALVEHPDQLSLLKEDPSLIDNAVDEIIRWVTPVRHFLRHAQEDYVLGDKTIRKGERVLLSYLSANRDEAVFQDPFKFDVRRANANQHLAFGIGVHFCLGAHLARLELRAFLRELLPRLESIDFSGACEDIPSTFVGGPKRVPIRYKIKPAPSCGVMPRMVE
jgi:cytochrome P450